MMMTTTTTRLIAVAAVAAAAMLIDSPSWVRAAARTTGQDAQPCSSDSCGRSAAELDDETELGAQDTTSGAASAAPRCERYSACSLHGDLSGADGETLEMYVREKKEDGRVFRDFRLPPFRAMSLSGEETSASGLTGSPALVAFVAVHCRHSMRSMPHLQEVADTFGPRGLRVVTVWVNSGSVEDVRETTAVFAPTYETWVHQSPAIGDAIESHLVPSLFFIGADGQVQEKWVGEKSRNAIVARVGALLDGAQAH